MRKNFLSSIEDVFQLIQQHEAYRSRCLNLIASENIPSPTVRRLLASDLGGRYPAYLDDPKHRDYRGNRFIAEMEIAVQELAKRIYRVDNIDFRPLGGHLAGIGAICGLTQPGDTVFETGPFGGHRTATKMINTSLLNHVLNVRYIPYDLETHDIDLSLLMDQIEQEKPRLIIFGRDQILFPEIIRPIVEFAKDVDTFIAYDFSHIHGLVVGKAFPNPLDQGAQVVFGSHHKTFPGPQGGLYMTRNMEISEKVRRGLYPAFVGNHHVERVLALAVAYLEMLEFGEAYARQIVKNSQALGRALYDRNILVLYKSRGFSQSHQILIDVGEFSTGDEAAACLEKANIICGRTMVPRDVMNGGGTYSGLRIGTQEITRVGMVEDDMDQAAALIERALVHKEAPERVSEDVKAFISRFNHLHFCFDESARPFEMIWR